LQGDVVTLIRCVDVNWYEGKLAGRQGLFPISYVEQLTDGDLSPVTSSLPLSIHINEVCIFQYICGSVYTLVTFAVGLSKVLQ